MNVSKDFAVYVTAIEDGTHLAASVGTPRFCFEGPTEEDVVAKAQRALAFYAGRAETASIRSDSIEPTIINFARSKAVNLEAA